MYLILDITDDAMDADELARWVALVENHPSPPSAALYEKDVADSPLYQRAKALAGGLPLIHCLLFSINKDNDQTELHVDHGEYVVLFYPVSNPLGPLLTVQDGKVVNIEVRANRLVQMNCTSIWHQQVIPPDGSTRYSVAFKFRLPSDEVPPYPARPEGF